MFKLISFIFITLFITSGVTIRKHNAITWSSKLKLSWKNFQGSIDSLSSHDASSFTTIFNDYSGGDTYLSIDISAVFYTDKSWKRDSCPSKKLLEHEQLHFDITELGARKIRKATLEKKITKLSHKQVIDSLCKIYNSMYYNEYKKIQINYDLETEHGKNEQKQLEWNNKIKKELDKYKKYANPIVIRKW